MMKRFVCILVLFCLPLICQSAESGKRFCIDEKCGDLAFYYSPGGGVQLSIFDVPVIKSTSMTSNMWVISPGWISRYYYPSMNPHLLDNATIEEYKGGKKITLYHKLPAEYDCGFEATETFILLPDNTYKVQLDYTYTKDDSVMIEYKIGEFNADIIIGSSYSADFGSAIEKGIVPVIAKETGIQESMLANSFKSLKMDSRLGPIKIHSDPNNNISIFDYRKNKWAQLNNPIFWFGALERGIKKDRQYSINVSIKFPDELDVPAAEKRNIVRDVEVIKEKGAKSPNWQRDYIIPTPKDLTYTGDRFALTSRTKVYVGKNSDENIERTLRFLLQDLEDLYHVTPKVIREDVEGGRMPKGAIILGTISEQPAAADVCTEAGLDIPEHKDGYCLLVDDNKAVITSTTTTGVFNGMTTLLQLCALDKKGLYLKGARIEDYPTLDIRGIHCLSSRTGADQISKAVRTLLARYKMNTMIWECEYIVWDSHPELEHPQYGMKKSDAVKVKEAAAENGIEIVPLVQSLGHSEWMFVGGNNLDLAEDPEMPYAYCPTNPKTYDFIFSVYQEALDFFKPRFFHIGHDEVNTSAARFPYRSLNSGKTVDELIHDDIMKLHDWFTEKGIRIMMWGDMFLYQDEAPDATFAETKEVAEAGRAALPKDIVITDWHYAPGDPEEFKSTKIWKDAGFDVLGSGWYTPLNIRNHNIACARAGAEGYIQTTWAGFNFLIDGNPDSWMQYWSYITAAHYAWSGDETRPEDLPFNPEVVFQDLWSERKPLLKDKKGFCLDLAPLYNRKLADDPMGSGWLGLGPEIDFSGFPTGEMMFDETKFLVNVNDAGAGAVMMAGKLNPKGDFPEAVTMKLKPQKVSEIHFLMNCILNTHKKARIGEIGVKYVDGTVEKMDLIYDQNIFFYKEKKIGWNADMAWKGITDSGQAVSVWDITWENPNPKKKIASITLTSANTEAAPVLFAVTGVN